MQNINNKGFTIVELMIALSILSVILVLSTIMLIRIGTLYTKGVNMANLQNTTRTIMADVSSSLQFGVSSPVCASMPYPAGSCAQSYSGIQVYSYCIGTSRYSYILDREVGTDTDAGNTHTDHVLWKDTMKDLSACPPLDLSASTVLADASSVEVAGTASKGYDMVSDHMRLTRFKIANSAAIDEYDIDVWMAYGDIDLLGTSGGRTICVGGTGSQFCAVSQLSTHLKRRI